MAFLHLGAICVWEGPAWVVLAQRGCPGPSSPNIFHFASENTEGQEVVACRRPLRHKLWLLKNSKPEVLALKYWFLKLGGTGWGTIWEKAHLMEGRGEASNEPWLALCWTLRKDWQGLMLSPFYR